MPPKTMLATTTPIDTRPRSVQQKRIGRPKTLFEAYVTVPTRCPAQIYTYLKGICPFRYPSLTAMFEDMMTRFLDERPWEAGFHFRRPRTAMTYAGGKAGRTGWEQVNLQLTPGLAQRIAVTAEEVGLSKAALVYTAISWWVMHVYPPNRFLRKP